MKNPVSGTFGCLRSFNFRLWTHGIGWASAQEKASNPH
jgi:hypothetical protein